MGIFKEPNRQATFEQEMMPHLADAYNLARWLTRNDQDAEDLTQEAYLRAFKFFEGFHGTNSRAWLLTIVRNTFYSRLPQKREQELTTTLDLETHNEGSEAYNPELLVLKSVGNRLLRQLLEELPLEYREVVILRELQDLSYKEISEMIGVPIGTVMSRLARARKRLEQKLNLAALVEGGLP